MHETSVLCYVINIHAQVAVPMPMGAGFGAGAPVLTRTRTRVVPTPGTRMGTPVPVLLPMCCQARISPEPYTSYFTFIC